METSKYLAEQEFEVRDYECDLQGVVNNANYQHYLEHARHKWLESLGIDFPALHAQGIDLVVVRIEIDYKSPLRSHDRFVVRTGVTKDGMLKVVCNQDIYRIPDEKPIARARVVTAALQNGRPVAPATAVPAIAGAIEGG